ncbi:MAG TPA: SAM-dependent methyltransferase [Actinocatenispora sp.]
MTEPDDWAGAADRELPSAARMYDYYLGGMHNFAADREMAERVLTTMPEGRLLARTNRSFLRRAVLTCLGAGIDQFLDLGSGIPTAGNVHEIARQADPSARIVYVDNDPVAVSHSLTLLGDDPRCAVVRADLRDTAAVLGHPDTHRVLDLTRPVAVLLVSVLHFLTDADRPYEVVDGYRRAAARGSMLVITHGSNDVALHPGVAEAQKLYEDTSNPWGLRTRAQIERFFGDWALVAPGLVTAAQWRPDTPPDPRTDALPLLAGAARLA